MDPFNFIWNGEDLGPLFSYQAQAQAKKIESLGLALRGVSSTPLAKT